MPPSPSAPAGAPQPSSAPAQKPHPHHVLLGAVSAIVLAIALFTGIELARSNSDIICTKSTADEGACSGGAWSQWSIDSQSTDTNACTRTYQEHRTYTGTREVVTGTFTFSANAHTHCNVGIPGNATGTFTTESAACQITENRTRVIQGTGAGPSCHVTDTDPNDIGDQRTVTSQTRTESTGATTTGGGATVTGSYQDYLVKLDSLATSTLWTVPSLVKRGETVRVIWTSNHMRACAVTATNGDGINATFAKTEAVSDADGNVTTQTTMVVDPKWQQLNSDPKGEDSSPITQQVVYTLRCTTPLGNEQVTEAIVGIIPVFQER